MMMMMMKKKKKKYDVDGINHLILLNFFLYNNILTS